MLLHPFLLIPLSAILNTMAQVLMKIGVNQIPSLPLGPWLLHCLSNPFIYGSVACYTMSLVVWVVALARVDVSYGVSILSVGYVLTVLAGVFFFKEPVNAVKIVGVLLIVGGIVCVSRSSVS